MAKKHGCNTRGEPVDPLPRMLAVGEQLITELAREKQLSKRGLKHANDATVLKERKESRRMVETLAEKYAEALAEYQKAMEQTIRVQSRRRGSWMPTPNRILR